MFIIGKRLYTLNLPNRPIDEKFAQVDQFSRYLASNYGEIYDKYSNRLLDKYPYCDLNQNKKKYYYRVQMIDDTGVKRNCRVNRIVLMTFDSRENYDNLEAHHKDEDTLNNHISNLQWTTHLENCIEYYLNKNNISIVDYIYTDENIHNICKYLEQSLSFEEISKIIGLGYNNKTKSYISAIRTGKIRKDISSQYNFPSKERNTAILTDDQIRFVCKSIVNNDNNIEIMKKLGYDYEKGSNERKSIYQIINRIRNKDRFTRISDMYF